MPLMTRSRRRSATGPLSSRPRLKPGSTSSPKVARVRPGPDSERSNAPLRPLTSPPSARHATRRGSSRVARSLSCSLVTLASASASTSVARPPGSRSRAVTRWRKSCHSGYRSRSEAIAKTACGLASISVVCSPRIMGAQGSGGTATSGRRVHCYVVKPNRRRSGGAGRGTRCGRMAAGANRRVLRRSATSAREPVSSPRRHNGRRETYVVDSRPSDLDPYPRLDRDLAAAELWDQSLARSRQRRRLEQASRSHRQRRKGTSLAVGAAVLAAPVVPAFAGSSGRASGSSPSGATLDTSSVAAATGGRTQLLSFGDAGPAVAAVQARVGTAADGIFGPLTRAAVARFQRSHRLSPSGVVDARTWAAVFNARVLFYDDSTATPSTAAAARRASAERASVRLVVDRDSGEDSSGERSGSGSAAADASRSV